MLIGIDKEGNIKQINNITDTTLKQIEVDREKMFPGYSDIRVLKYRYIEHENGFNIEPQKDVIQKEIEKLESQQQMQLMQKAIDDLILGGAV